MKGASGVPAWSPILVGLIVCISLPLAGQQRAESGQASQSPNSPELTLTTTVNRVLVDVMVTDAHGNPVHGLTQGDFTSYINASQGCCIFGGPWLCCCAFNLATISRSFAPSAGR
jgi:hypothetical protein